MLLHNPALQGLSDHSLLPWTVTELLTTQYQWDNGAGQPKASELIPGSLLPCSNSMWFFARNHSIKPSLIGGEEICNPVPAKFKHFTNIETCTLLCCDWIMYVPTLWNFQKADFEPYHVGKKYITFSSLRQGALAWNICLRDPPTCWCIQLYT